MTKQTLQLRRLVTMSMLLAISIILNIVENYIVVIPIPAAKIGLANIVALILLYSYGFKPAFSLTLLRVLLVSLLLPGRFLGPVFWMGLAGAFLAVVTMGLVKKIKIFGIIGTSIFGAIMHTVGQVIVGYFLIGEGLLAYLALMAFASIITGFITGLIARQFLKVTKDWFQSKDELKKAQHKNILEELRKTKTSFKKTLAKVANRK
ncbi:MAG: Gx transporter family protein [Acholeplasmataceae bacterium]|jgi:heptaprenyl diphosphate synthase|nr:Gx transporter family protein [Acholeplasmataceae bacterium]